MTRASIAEYVEAVRGRYLRASKMEKGKILDEFTKVIGCHRKAAIRSLRRWNQQGAKRKRGRPRRYGIAVAEALRVVWEATDRLCSKRLHPFLPELVKILRRRGNATMTADIEAQLCRMSPSTIDRLLCLWRRLGGRRPFTTTKPGSLLKSSIPIRTFADWQEDRPGFLEVDLVSHCGESSEGFYLTTLSTVDVAMGIPDEQKLTEAFKVMDYDDRLAFRETMDSQIADIDRMLYEHEMELAGIEEFLKTDPVATYVGHVGKRKISLMGLIKKGDFPESFTVKEAEMLGMGAKPKTIINGRVPKAYVLDHLADHFRMTEDQLVERTMHVADQRIAVDDLRMLIGMGKGRNDNIKRMLGILNDVDTKPEFILKTEVGVSTGARPVPEGEYRLAAGERPRAVINKQIESVRMELSGLEAEIPKAEAGMPEAGLQQDIFGYQTPVFPKGKGQVTQISMEDYAKLAETWKKAGLPDDALPIAIKPKIDRAKWS